MKTVVPLTRTALAFMCLSLVVWSPAQANPPAKAPASDPAEGPAAALNYARGFRGETYTPNVQHCYPDAKGVPFADCEHIVPMTHTLWTPRQIAADFQRRMADLPP